MKLTAGKVPAGDVMIYEYGVRLDKECVEATNEQIAMARRLYNELVATITGIVTDMNAFIIDHAPAEAQELQARIDKLNRDFMAARASNDEDAMKTIAAERRGHYPRLWELLSRTRKELKSELSARFLSRIGRNSKCDTYRLRSKAVDEGLGWATANAVLDNAMQAFAKSIKKGRAPRFCKGADKVQDTLTLQFVASGGVPSDALLHGRHNELGIIPTNGCGRRKYGELRFRLGAAKAGTNATGTWQYHRPLPDGSHVGLARLVRRRVGKDTKWALQLMVKLAQPLRLAAAQEGGRAPMVAIHMGWAADVSGRRVAGIADAADPGMARLVQLPSSIEDGLQKAAEVAGNRDTARDQIVPLIKEMAIDDTWPEDLTQELAAIRKLPVQHVAVRRVHRLCRQLASAEAIPEWLEAWRKQDRLLWQDASHRARRARNARRTFYRNLALELASSYESIVIEPLDLAAAATKIDEQTGERSEFGKKARAGRVVAALYELESAIRWAATKCGTAVLELTTDSASRCSICAGQVAQANEENHQELACTHCGARLDRKLNGAAAAWKTALEQREDAITDFWLQHQEAREEQKRKKQEKQQKQQAARRDARTQSEQQTPEGIAIK